MNPRQLKMQGTQRFWPISVLNLPCNSLGIQFWHILTHTTHLRPACEGIVSDRRSATRSDFPEGYQTYSVRGASGWKSHKIGACGWTKLQKWKGLGCLFQLEPGLFCHKILTQSFLDMLKSGASNMVCDCLGLSSCTCKNPVTPPRCRRQLAQSVLNRTKPSSRIFSPFVFAGPDPFFSVSFNRSNVLLRTAPETLARRFLLWGRRFPCQARVVCLTMGYPKI